RSPICNEGVWHLVWTQRPVPGQGRGDIHVPLRVLVDRGHASRTPLLPPNQEGTKAMSLPPGQRVIDWFPRFGIPFWEPPPRIAGPALICVTGAVARPIDVPVARLAELPRRSLVADFHCVTGWTAPGRHWEGVAFAGFYQAVIVPEAGPDPAVSH